MWTIDLNGHTAVITGGTRNIGLATAQALLAHGAKVCIVGGSDQGALTDALEILGGESNHVAGLLASVADDTDIRRIFDFTEQRLGSVSILINGAANRPHQPFIEISRDQWNAVIDVALTGPFRLTQELFKRLPPEQNGAIVNLGGLSAHKPVIDRPHVIAAKAGLMGLTKATAAEGMGRIRVNMVVPGAIDTHRKPGQSVPHKASEPGVMPPGSAADVARAILPFADPSDLYVTGQTVHVNGGRFMP